MIGQLGTSVKEGRSAIKDLSLDFNHLCDILHMAKDCGQLLCWLGDYAGLDRKQSLVPWSPEIKDALYRALLGCRSAYAALMWTELFDIPVRLNTPGTEGGTNWRPRMPFTAETAARMPQSEWLSRISVDCNRALIL